MTTSLIFAFIGYTSLAIVSILDKFILTDESETGHTSTSPAVYAFYSTIFFLGLIVLIPFCNFAVFKSPLDIFYLTLSGVSFGFAMWTMFVALRHGEASHIAPFIGAVVAVSTFALSHWFLGEVFTLSVKIGLSLLIASCFMLSFEKSKTHNGFHIGFVWAIASGILFAMSHVSAKYIYTIYPQEFFSNLILTKGTVGIVGLIALCVPDVWRTLFKKKEVVIQKEIKEVESLAAHKSNVGIILSDKIIGVVGVICIQYAISTGSVTIVNALAGIQYALMFVIIYSLTKLAPKLFSEFFTKQELLLETMAITISIIGLFFLR